MARGAVLVRVRHDRLWPLYARLASWNVFVVGVVVVVLYWLDTLQGVSVV
jgi:hypothetical protein